MNDMCLELSNSQELVFAPHNPLNSSDDNTSSRSAATSSSLVDKMVHFEGASETQHLTITQLPHTAFMLNYDFEVVWFNRKAEADLVGLFEHLPHGNADRSIFKLLLRREETQLTKAMLEMSVALAKERKPLENILQSLRGMPSPALQKLKRTYTQVQGRLANLMLELPQQRSLQGNTCRNFSVHVTYFREGILIVLPEQHASVDDLLSLLEHRDVVIRTLLTHQLPVQADRSKQGGNNLLRHFSVGLKLQLRLMASFLPGINCLKQTM